MPIIGWIFSNIIALVVGGVIGYFIATNRA